MPHCGWGKWPGGWGESVEPEVNVLGQVTMITECDGDSLSVHCYCFQCCELLTWQSLEHGFESGFKK